MRRNPKASEGIRRHQKEEGHTPAAEVLPLLLCLVGDHHRRWLGIGIGLVARRCDRRCHRRCHRSWIGGGWCVEKRRGEGGCELLRQAKEGPWKVMEGHGKGHGRPGRSMEGHVWKVMEGSGHREGRACSERHAARPPSIELPADARNQKQSDAIRSNLRSSSLPVRGWREAQKWRGIALQEAQRCVWDGFSCSRWQVRRARVASSRRQELCFWIASECF